MKPLLLLLLTCMAAPAQLAIYNFTGTMAVVGQGFEIAPRHTGVLIIDLATSQALRIAKFQVRGIKRIASGSEANFNIWLARSSPTEARAMVSSGYATNSPTAYRHEFQNYVGKVSLIPIGARTFTLPRSFKGTLYYLQNDHQPISSVMANGTFTHSFSTKATEESRQAGETLTAAADRYLALYRTQGYSDN